jgi:CRP-like cAMP-binding protein/tRNA A-37 threonylcarbamoyl transferase component Bud32
MTNPFLPAPAPPAVRVTEAIPAAGKSTLTPAQIASEKIPSPPHLLLGRELARGAMGHVHPATDRNLLRQVALKRIDKDYATRPLYRDGFIAEAQITGQLEHPNIVPVHELVIDANGIAYFTMKLVQGDSFDKWLRKHPPGAVDRIAGGIEILLKVCDALAYAHHRGVVHRDIKPANIMVGDFGQVYLMDWGLAKLVHSEPGSGAQALMNSKGAVGTADYMAPEQARGNPADVDARSDVFGMGALLFEILSGEGPYGSTSEATAVLVKRAAAGEVQSIDAACERFGIARRIRAVAERATRPDPADRYQSIAEMQDAMRAFLHGGLHLPRKTFAPGEMIVREGDSGDEAYMIVAGRCRAFRTVDGVEETLATMEPGDAFGEMALILFEPRAASVVAIDHVTVTVLDQATMNEGLGLSGWTGALVRALAQRFSDLEQMVRSTGLRRG